MAQNEDYILEILYSNVLLYKNILNSQERPYTDENGPLKKTYDSIWVKRLTMIIETEIASDRFWGISVPWADF